MHTIELTWMHNLHHYRTPFFDQFFKFLNHFDQLEFYVGLVLFVLLIKGWKMALKWGYILLICGIVNHALKVFFSSLRPFDIDPSIGIIHVKGFGFPSGAAQAAVLIAGIVVYEWKNSWKWLLAFIYVALISFSRVYLGVHFPSDILAGWTVGLLLLFLYRTISPHIDKSLSPSDHK